MKPPPATLGAERFARGKSDDTLRVNLRNGWRFAQSLCRT
jgi:hypothetical protein